MSDILDNYRLEINNIDEELLTLLKKRMKLSIKVGKFKKENNIPILNKNRENQVLERINTYNKKDNEIIISENFIDILWTSIMNYSKDLQ